MKKNIVIVTLIVVILILGGSLLYLNMNKDKIGCKNTCQKESSQVVEQETKENTEVKEAAFGLGKYEFKEEYEAGTYKDIIEFMEDGTYFELITHTMGTAFYGTYKVEGEKITLNQTFKMDNEALGGSKEEKTYIITVENDKMIKDNGDRKITLVKNNNADSAKNKFIKWTSMSAEEYSKSVSNN